MTVEGVGAIDLAGAAVIRVGIAKVDGVSGASLRRYTVSADLVEVDVVIVDEPPATRA